MFTIRERALFKKQVENILNEEERLELFSFVAENPFAGDVVKNTGGMRKLRWQSSGKGKRGGARVVYLNYLDDGVIEMVTIYEKKQRPNIQANELMKIKGE